LPAVRTAVPGLFSSSGLPPTFTVKTTFAWSASSSVTDDTVALVLLASGFFASLAREELLVRALDLRLVVRLVTPAAAGERERREEDECKPSHGEQA
jgi:hypothetical protein